MNIRDSKIYNLIQLEKDQEQYDKDMADYPFELGFYHQYKEIRETADNF
jgi:hypothetical protein